MAVYILRLFLRLVESNGRKEIMRTETLKEKKKKLFTMSVKYSMMLCAFVMLYRRMFKKT